MSTIHFIAGVLKPELPKCKCSKCSILSKTVVNLFILATGFCFSQECNLVLEGKVVDLHDNSPVSAAVIQVVGSDETVFSNADGVFILENQCPKKINLKISHLNCEDLYTEFNINKSTSRRFYLEHHIESLEEVVVEESKIKKLSSTAPSYALTELQKDQYSGRGLAKALEQISGVNILNTGNVISKPVIHGMFGSRVGIIYDGVPIENQQWGQDHAPNIDQNAFEEIRLIKGAGVLKYSGDTPGGVVVLESKLPKIADSLYGKTILNGMSNGRGLNLISSWTKSFQSGNYFKVQGTIKRNGDFSAPDYVLSNTGTNENNISLSLGQNKILSQWKTNFSFFSQEIGILRSAHVGNVYDLVTAIESDTPTIINPFSYQINFPKQVNKHYTAGIQYSKRNSSNGKWTAKYSWQRNNRKEYDVRRGSYKNKAAIDLTLDTHNLTTNYEWGGSKWTFDSGAFLQIQDNYSNPNTGIKRLIPDYIKTRLGAYFTSSYTPSNDFSLGFGFRYGHQNNQVKKFYKISRWNKENYEERLGAYVIREVLSQKLVEQRLIFNNLSLSTGVKYLIDPDLKLRLNFFHTERAPDIAEMFSDGLHHSLASIEYGNPFLKSEITQKFVINFEKERGNFRYNFSPYLTYGQNYIVIEPKGFELTIRGAFPVWEYRPVSAIIRGFDLDLSLRLGERIELKNNSSWIEGYEKVTKTPLINIPSFTTTNQIQFSFPKWKSFLMSLSSKSVLRQNQFPNHNFETSVVENGKRVRKLVDISTPSKGYHLLGMELHWGAYPFFSDKISISLIFDNLLDTSYRNYLNRLRFYADEMGRNIMLQIKINH
ncbi:MAG: TonB-dependent receptor [Flavobacteriaceae bacterium]